MDTKNMNTVSCVALSVLLFSFVSSGCGTARAESGSDECRIIGTPKVVTADTDPNQIVDGIVEVLSRESESAQIVEGPFLLTDASARFTHPDYPDAYDVALSITSGQQCPTTFDDDNIRYFVSQQPGIHGARILVPDGSILCARCSGLCEGQKLAWSGFRPY